MRRIAATFTVVATLLFSAAGPVSADFLSDVLSDTGLSKEATFEGVYCKGTEGAYKRDQSCKYGDKRISKESYDRLTDEASDTASKIKEPKAAAPKLEVLNALYVALKNANVRERPDVKSPRVATLPKGGVITALGKVKGV